MMQTELKKHIEQAWDHPDTFTQEVLEDLFNELLAGLESGLLRAAEKMDGTWQTHSWIKQGILLYFKNHSNQLISGGFTQFYDKVPLQFQQYTQSDFQQNSVRIVPPACVRRGAHLGSNTVFMPSYVNIGAFVDSGTLIDTWATIGSCAQIGKNVHISGGVGIGGVLEPLQATPTIIEDNCFIGARSEIVEGVIVEQNSVISMGVYIGQSTRIYDRQNDQILYGRIPAGSVVVPGTLPDKNGKYGLYCAIIVKTVDEKTRTKVGINRILRDISEENL